MKRLSNPVLPDYRPKAEREAVQEVPLKPCLICNKMTHAYGSWVDGNTCSRKCESEQEAKPHCFGE